jgi:hypothetical protein
MGSREIIAATGILILCLGLMWFLMPFGPGCTTSIVKAGARLNESYDRLEAAKGLGKPALCAAYRHHIEVLEAVVFATRGCGPALMTPRSVWPHPETELSGYRQIVAEQCSF